MVQKHDPELELAETFADMARGLFAQPDVDRSFETVCKLAVVTVKGCEAAGVSLTRAGAIASLTTTDELPRRLDDLQYGGGQGPSVDAVGERTVFVTGSLSEESRWPAFASPGYAVTGVQSVLSLRLFASKDTIRALNLYSRQPTPLWLWRVPSTTRTSSRRQPRAR